MRLEEYCEIEKNVNIEGEEKDEGSSPILDEPNFPQV